MEEEHACSDGEPDDATSDPESVLQDAAAEPPLPPPPTPPFSSGRIQRTRRILRRREMLERCIALRLVCGCCPSSRMLIDRALASEIRTGSGRLTRAPGWKRDPTRALGQSCGFATQKKQLSCHHIGVRLALISHARHSTLFNAQYNRQDTQRKRRLR